MTRLVILRPEPGASATAAAARELGLQPVVLPLFATEPVAWRAPDPGDFDALLLTSANAARHGGSELHRLCDLPAHCVGEATATAAHEAGLAIASTGTGGIDALLDLLPPGKRLLHLCGVDRRVPQSPKQTVSAVPVYRAVEIEPGDAIRSIDGSVVAVHSPRAAARLSALAGELGLRRDTIGIAAISDEAAGAAGPGWRTVKAAAEPSDSALLALAARLCNKPD
jgi:uroporphyrinogen-III synthase